MQELCNLTAILHHCSRVPGKPFAVVVDSSWRNLPLFS